MQKTTLEILIVDDDPIIAKLHKFLVNKIGYNDPKTFRNGKEAISYLDIETKENKSFLILVDLNMPVMNGWEFLSICRSRPYAQQLNVVIVTSSSYREDREKAQEFDMVVDYYTKPLKKDSVAEILLGIQTEV